MSMTLPLIISIVSVWGAIRFFPRRQPRTPTPETPRLQAHPLVSVQRSTQMRLVERMLGSQYRVLPHATLTQLFSLKGRVHWSLQRIWRKHHAETIDFAIYRLPDYKLVCLIDTRKRSHVTWHALKGLAAAASVPLVRLSEQPRYVLSDVAKLLRDAGVIPSDHGLATEQRCPTCGAHLVALPVTRGNEAGSIDIVCGNSRCGSTPPTHTLF